MLQIILSIILASGLFMGATVGAANAAVPGDALYEIDRGMENLRLQMTSDPEAAAQLKLEYTQERLDEIQKLAERGDQENLLNALAELDTALSELDQTVDSDPVDQDGEEFTNTGNYCSNLESQQHPTGANLAEQHGVIYSDIMGWFCTGYGFGEIDLAYTIADAAQLPVEDIFALRASGMGWGQIMQEFGLAVNPDDSDDDTDPEEDGDVEEEGEEVEDPEEKQNTGNYCSNLESQQHPTGAKLAGRYGVSYSEIMGWFCQGYGFGEIDLAYSIAQQVGVDVQEVFGLRASGMGWGEIKAYYGLTGKPDKDKVKPEKDKDKKEKKEK